jgi:hypothetical protein
MIRPGSVMQTDVSPIAPSTPMPMPAVTPTTAPRGMMGFFNNASSTPGHFLGRDERREARMARRETRQSARKGI